MATVTLLLKQNKVNEKGEMPLYLRIIKTRKAKFISLGKNIHPDLWDETKQRVKKRFPNSARVNSFITKKVSEAEAAIVDLEINKKYFNSKKIKEAIIGKEPISFLNYAEKYQSSLLSKGKIGTYKKVKAILQKLKDYLNNADITFDEFDFSFLKKYEDYLRNELGNGINTIHSNLKIFRKIFNDAIREERVDFQLNPFPRYKLALEKTTKSYLTEEELTAIENLPLKENTVMFHHRNLYVFAAYAGGIRISDLLQLKWQNFDGTHIRILMQKTKEPIVVKLPAKALVILRIYASSNPGKQKTDFIFPLLSNSADYSAPKILFNAISSNTAYANKNLKVIAQKAEIDKNISFHSSRHTWATRALRKGMRIEYVSKLMGHNSIKTTQVYTKIVNSELDLAMDVFN